MKFLLLLIALLFQNICFGQLQKELVTKIVMTNGDIYINTIIVKNDFDHIEILEDNKKTMLYKEDIENVYLLANEQQISFSPFEFPWEQALKAQNQFDLKQNAWAEFAKGQSLSAKGRTMELVGSLLTLAAGFTANKYPREAFIMFSGGVLTGTLGIVLDVKGNKKTARVAKLFQY